MLLHSTIEKLQQLKCQGMLQALEEQLQQEDIEQLPFNERLALLLDRELTLRENRRLQSRLRQAKLKQSACIEFIDFKLSRGLDKSLLLSLASCQWIQGHHNILLTGPTGTGKTFIGCALAHKACLEGYTAYYVRVSRLLQELSVAKGDGRYTKLIAQLAKIDCLLLDDWGLSSLNDEQRRDLLEILDDRHHVKSTIVTSQFPVKEWHDMLNDPTLADAILDRLVHNAYKLHLTGESVRKQKSLLEQNHLTEINKIENN